jgi:hypothetical protein
MCARIRRGDAAVAPLAPLFWGGGAKSGATPSCHSENTNYYYTTTYDIYYY